MTPYQKEKLAEVVSAVIGLAGALAVGSLFLLVVAG